MGREDTTKEVQCSTVEYSGVQCSTVQYTVQYSAVQCSIQAEGDREGEEWGGVHNPRLCGAGPRSCRSIRGRGRGLTTNEVLTTND